jgi:cytochrome c oxidase subunit 2
MLNTIQSMLSASGIQAMRIESLWWLMFWVTLAVQVAVLIFVAIAIRRPRAATENHDTSRDAPLLRGVGIATALSVVILFVLLVASIVTGRAVASQRDETALVVEVIGYQWWWNVEYQHPEPEQRVRTANELHIPVGRTVAVKLLSNDVIHSFWAPALHGKMDLIPGHSAVLWLRADEAGVFRGQCAEYCGVQHAHMAFSVVAEPSDVFERWIQAQRVTATEPPTEEARRGRQIVQSGPCGMCHTVRGTSASARTAPDLTHVATRSTLAAGTLPNTRDNLVRWISDPQGVKPGTRMPRIDLSNEDLQAVVAYLQVLK